MSLNLKRLACLIAVAAVASCLPSSASAGMINVLVSNFDVAFDGSTGELTDFQRPDGGNLDPNEARTVTSVEVEVNGATPPGGLVMNPPDALWADLKVTNLGSELTTGALVAGAGGTGDPNAFGFDFFSPTGDQLRLGIDDISYTVVTTAIPGLNFFNFFAEAKVLSQSLPGGAILAEDVLISYTATEVMTFSGQNGVRTLVASGQMTITGNMIPEPATTGLLGLGLVGLSTASVRRRRS